MKHDEFRYLKHNLLKHFTASNVKCSRVKSSDIVEFILRLRLFKSTSADLFTKHTLIIISFEYKSKRREASFLQNKMAT